MRGRIGARALGLVLASRAAVISGAGSARVGAGAWRVVRWDTEALALAAWDEHHEGRPYLDEVLIRPRATGDRVIEDFRYGRADLVLRDSPRYEGARRLRGPVCETVGLMVRDRAATRAATRWWVMASAPRGDLADRVPGRGEPAGAWSPHRGAPSLVAGKGEPARWFLGAPVDLEDVGRAVATALGGSTAAWPLQPLDAMTWRSAVTDGSGRWDALLVSRPHATASPAVAVRALDPVADVTRTLAWIPLVDRGRTLVHTGRLRGLRWSADGMLALTEAWRP